MSAGFYSVKPSYLVVYSRAFDNEIQYFEKFQKNWKRLLTFQERGGIIILAPLIQQPHNLKIEIKSRKKLKKVVDKSKTAWYTIQAVAEKGNNKKHLNNWRLNNTQTLKIQRTKARKTAVSSREFRTKPSKTGKIKARVNQARTNHNKRVWSWLRMNAGGVLNTCKSSGGLKRKFSDGSNKP